MSETIEVVHQPERARFTIFVDGVEAGHAATRPYGSKAINVHHTEIDDAFGGRGLGSKLVKGTLDQIRDSGLKVVPGCPFVQSYIEKHPEYEDLLAPSGPAED